MSEIDRHKMLKHDHLLSDHTADCPGPCEGCVDVTRDPNAPGERWRRLADWCDRHPEYAALIHPPLLSIHVRDRAAFVKAARDLGQCEKYYTDNYAWLEARIAGIAVTVSVERGLVCECVVRREWVTRPKMIDSGETETVEIEHVEWQCPESLLAPDGGAEADSA